MKGWHKESYRHYLAGKGIKTKRYMNAKKVRGKNYFGKVVVHSFKDGKEVAKALNVPYRIYGDIGEDVDDEIKEIDDIHHLVVDEDEDLVMPLANVIKFESEYDNYPNRRNFLKLVNPDKNEVKKRLEVVRRGEGMVAKSNEKMKPKVRVPFHRRGVK